MGMFSKGRVDLGDAIAADGSAVVWFGGKGTFIAEADTWSSAAAIVQMQSPDDTWIDVSGTQLLAGGVVSFDLPPCSIRVGITGTPTNLSAWAIHNGE